MGASGHTWKRSYHTKNAKIGISLHRQVQEDKAMPRSGGALLLELYNV